MPNIDYPRVIEEDLQELEKPEKRHRYSHLFHRVKMLRLLKSEECLNLGEAAEALGYSRRQCQGWFITYREEGLEELLVSRVGERGPTGLITQQRVALLLTRSPAMHASYRQDLSRERRHARGVAVQFHCNLLSHARLACSQSRVTSPLFW